LLPAPAASGPIADVPAIQAAPASITFSAPPPVPVPVPVPVNDARARLWPVVRAEAVQQGVPPALADAVAIVETGYTPSAVGSSGEIGLMQIMPATARGLGFVAPMNDLFVPETNIHFGVAYLARAWAASGGNACRALMKYRAGVAQEGYSPLSIQYCRRAAAWLRGQDATLADNVAANTPAAPNLADPFVVAGGRSVMRFDVGAFQEIAGISGGAVEAAPISAWHIKAGPHHANIQAVVDAAISDQGDPHVIHMPSADQ
jgi:soluble lytic murein transglycosylase-like protein